MAALLSLWLSLVAVTALAETEPDYSEWNRILKSYYDPARGMDYASLKAKDSQAIQTLREQLGKVDTRKLNPKERLAYWLNVYNINTVATIVDNYPVKSIRDISTDPVIRRNVFKKERVPYRGRMLSLDDVEHRELRATFRDPRIHFALNAAARSCPPLRTEAYVGDRLEQQLEEQTRSFLSSPQGVRFKQDGKELDISTTQIMEWYAEDFDKWGGGKAAFIRKYVPADKQRMIDAASQFDFDYDTYDWTLNEWKR